MPIRVPLSWLREYIDVEVAPEELARRLTLAGQEVEHITTIGAEWENIWTGRVKSLRQHPNADRLYLATVEYGAGREITVVTGAPNIREGQAVVIGLVGSPYIDQHASPPKWARLKPAKIRGIETEGMVMSEAELGLSVEHEGIIVLDPSTTLGLPARDVLGDTILHIEVTPNNGRVLSIIGVAREVAAIFGGQVRYPSTEWQAEGPPVRDLLDIEIADPDLCPRYSGAVLQGVKIGLSPAWMQRRLTLAGMRPINNIVDVTNYVMLEMGQPLHAFDYHAVEGHKIIVRRARRGERLTTIDHVDRELDPNMLAICDVSRPVALAGVMGGAESEIGEGSSDVILESAHFNPLSVRRTARILKLPSEASHRFERFVDPELTVPAMKRAAELMRQHAGATIANGYIDVYPRPYKPVRIHFYTSEVDRLLGIHVPPTRIAEILRRLEFGVDLPPNADTVGADTTMLVDVPSYRNDVSLPCDLVEEVARINGYDLIPETLLEGKLPPQEPNRNLQLEERIRDIMVSCGLDEVITYSPTYSLRLQKLAEIESSTLTNRDGTGTATEEEQLKPPYLSWDSSRPLVTIVNPLSNRQDVMRSTMLPNMLDTLQANLKVQAEMPVRIFDIGKVFLTPNEKEVADKRARLAAERERYPRMQEWEGPPGEERLPLEPRRLAGVMSGPREPRSLYNPEPGIKDQMDFFDAKGAVEELLAHLHVAGVEYIPADAPLFHPGRVAAVRAQGVDLGVLGELHPSVVEEWELPGSRRVAVWELDVDALARLIPERVLYGQTGPYPPVLQDMAFVVEESTPAAVVAELIKKAGAPAATDVTLFDVYMGKPVPEGHKSLAFGVTFASPEKPLTEEEVARLRKRIESRLKKDLGAELRT
jgi:phenylalanyl-tRNA synthetase beta chain